MIVERRTFPVKTTKEQEVVALVKATIEAITIFTGAYRIYVHDIGPQEVVVVEWEHDNLEDLQAAWEAWMANLATPEFWEQWCAITERGGHKEIWELAAER